MQIANGDVKIFQLSSPINYTLHSPPKKRHMPLLILDLSFFWIGGKKKKTYPQPIKLLDGLCMRHVRQLHGIAAIVGTLICHRLPGESAFLGEDQGFDQWDAFHEKGFTKRNPQKLTKPFLKNI